MALFFDQKWFNQQLEEAGLGKDELAHALGLSRSELAEMWKDQREISGRELSTMALLLGASEAEVRKRGGIQGNPEARTALKSGGNSTWQADHALETRLARIEARLDEIFERLQKRS